jgi:hypothetical protein
MEVVMEIRMLETRCGSNDGRTVHWYEKGQIYSVGHTLSCMFIREGAAHQKDAFMGEIINTKRFKTHRSFSTWQQAAEWLVAMQKFCSPSDTFRINGDRVKIVGSVVYNIEDDAEVDAVTNFVAERNQNYSNRLYEAFRPDNVGDQLKALNAITASVLQGGAA